MCPTGKKFKHKAEADERRTITKPKWMLKYTVFLPLCPFSYCKSSLLPHSFPKQKKLESAVRQSLSTFSSERLHVFSPSSACGFFWSAPLFCKDTTNTKKKKKSSGLVQKLCWPVDVSVEWAEGQSERCHSSLLSPVWVCSLGTGTTRATAANKGPLSGSACCTQWHQLSPPTSSSKHTMRGRETANTHTYTHKPFPRRIQTTTTHHHPNLLPKYEESCRGLLIKV